MDGEPKYLSERFISYVVGRSTDNNKIKVIVGISDQYF